MATKKAVPAKKAVSKKAPAKKAAADHPPPKKAPAKQAAKPAPAKKAVARGQATQLEGITVPATLPGDQPYPFEASFLQGQRDAPLAERTRYVRHADHLESEAASLAADREAGDVQFDEESGEGDRSRSQRERDLARSAQARTAVAEIDAALARLAAGTYGISTASGLPIPEERLEAIPRRPCASSTRAAASVWR